MIEREILFRLLLDESSVIRHRMARRTVNLSTLQSPSGG